MPCLERWRQAREDGLDARSAAAAVGVPLSTLYRWRKRAEGGRLEPLSRRPRRVRRAKWAPVAAVREARNDYPMRGKAKIAVLIQRQGFDAGESAIGRILKTLVEKGAVFPIPALRRKAPWATRLSKGRKPSRPGEIVQLDTLSIAQTAGRPTIEQFTARPRNRMDMRPGPETRNRSQRQTLPRQTPGAHAHALPPASPGRRPP